MTYGASFGVSPGHTVRREDPFGGKTVRFKKSRTGVKWYVWRGQESSGYSLLTITEPRQYRNATAGQLELVALDEPEYEALYGSPRSSG